MSTNNQQPEIRDGGESSDPSNARGGSESDDFSIDNITKFLSEKLHLKKDSGSGGNISNNRKVIKDLTLDGLIKHWKNNGVKKIITMVGAGISTSAGIPDFRTPGSGLYDNLSKYNLPHPTAIFEMDYFIDNPKPFFVLAKELYPGSFKPTPCHYFVRMLHEKGLLLRHYTQNIDTLERIAGIPGDKLVEAHGTFYTNHCIGCRKVYSMEWMKTQIFADVVPTCEKCNSLVKPDIVFFGENLPERFYELPQTDFEDCDLLIIMGTSLEVHPFASLVDNAEENCLRLLINREKVGRKKDASRSWFTFGTGLMYGRADNKRDMAYIGDCDDGVLALADGLGWGDELRKLVADEHRKLGKGDEEEDECWEGFECEKEDGSATEAAETDRDHEADAKSNEKV